MQAMAKRKRSKKAAATEAVAETPSSAPEATEAPEALVPPVAETAPDPIEQPAAAAEPAAPPPPAEEPTEPAAPLESTAEAAWPESEAAPQSPAEAWPWPEGNGEEATGEADAAEPAQAASGTEEPEPPLEGSRLLSIIESLLFASDKPLGLSELKRLLGERDGKKVSAALEELVVQRKGTGVEVAVLSTGWLLRTNPDNAAWVSRLLVGKPMRLSRAMLETLAIVAYRQPVTRPEIDDIRGVDCGPVLKTLLDRGLVRIIGKKEEVGRPMLYGTTPEFLRVFNLRELAELPTLREFYDLSAEDQSRVEAEHGPAEPETSPSAISSKPEVALGTVSRGELPPEPEETDPLIDELDEASRMAKQALGKLEPSAAEEAAAEPDKADGEPATTEEPPPSMPSSTE
jgi:segregation and condensation protein B